MKSRPRLARDSAHPHRSLAKRSAIRLLVSLIAVHLGACGALSGEKQIGGNRYLLEESYGVGDPYPEAVAALERRAEGLCDQGFRKVNDYDRLAGERKILVWDIICRGEFEEYDGFTILGRPN